MTSFDEIEDFDYHWSERDRLRKVEELPSCIQPVFNKFKYEI